MSTMQNRKRKYIKLSCLSRHHKNREYGNEAIQQNSLNMIDMMYKMYTIQDENDLQDDASAKKYY